MSNVIDHNNSLKMTESSLREYSNENNNTENIVKILPGKHKILVEEKDENSMELSKSQTNKKKKQYTNLSRNKENYNNNNNNNNIILENDLLNNVKKPAGNNIIININNHINNNLVSNNNIHNTTGNNINNKNLKENVPKNVNIIFRNSSRKVSELKNLDKKIRIKKKNSFNNNNIFENENDKNNIQNVNSNEKTEEAKLNDDKVFEINENCFYVTLNRFIYSDKCLIYYYLNIAIAVVLLFLAFVKCFFVENEIKLLFVSILIIQDIAAFSLILDLVTRLYVLGCKSIKTAKYTIFINDLLIFANLAINNFLCFSNNNPALNYLNFLNIVFACLLIIRFICIIVVLRNTRKKQKNLRQNIEEIINFSEMFDDTNKKNKEYKNCENNSNKYNPAISFIEEDTAKIKKENATSNSQFKKENFSQARRNSKMNNHIDNNDYAIEENNNVNEFRNEEIS